MIVAFLFDLKFLTFQLKPKAKIRFCTDCSKIHLWELVLKITKLLIFEEVFLESFICG